jgi:hypothetical protein
MFGVVDKSILNVYGFLLGAYSADSMSQAESPDAAVLIGSLFMFFVVIVMLNLLIAIMGDKYDQVQENVKSEFNFGRAKIILEYESIISEGTKKEHRQEWYPPWLQVLQRVSDSNNLKADWNGKIKAIKDTIHKRIDRLEGKIDKLVDSQIQILRHLGMPALDTSNTDAQTTESTSSCTSIAVECFGEPIKPITL